MSDGGHRHGRLARFGSWAATASSLTPRNPLLRRALWVAIGALVVGSVVLAILSARSAASGIEWRFEPGLLVLALVGLALLQVWHGTLWLVLLRQLHGRIDPRRGFSIWCVSILARYVPSGMLMPIVRAAMASREGVPKRVTFASVVYELALSTSGALVIGAWFFIQLPALDGDPRRFLALAFPIAALVVLHPRIFRRLSGWVLARFGREPLPLTPPAAAVVGLMLLYAGSFVLAGAATLAMAGALHPVGAGALPDILAAFSVAYVASVLAFVLPAGVGAREAALAAALSPVLPTTVAIAVAVAIRVGQILIELGFAAVASLVGLRGSRATAPDVIASEERSAV